MANTERPEGQPPAAWVWSQYRGVATADSPTAESHAEAPAEAADTPKNPAAIGLGLVAAILVIAGLTWLFTTKPASEPAAPENPASEAPAASQKSEAAPTPQPEPEPQPTTAPAPVSTPAPAAAAQEPAKPAATPPAPSPHHGDKKKKHR